MSTVMYCWRIKKGDFWNTMHELKQDALMNHGAIAVACQSRNTLLSVTGSKTTVVKAQYDEDMWRMFQTDDNGLLAVQLFDEGRTWLVRPLYYGYQFDEQVKRLGLPLKEVIYDGRVGEGTRGGEKKAEWMDDKINSGEYLIHIILGKDEPFNAVVYDMWPKGYEKTRVSGL